MDWSVKVVRVTHNDVLVTGDLVKSKTTALNIIKRARSKMFIIKFLRKRSENKGGGPTIPRIQINTVELL